MFSGFSESTIALKKYVLFVLIRNIYVAMKDYVFI